MLSKRVCSIIALMTLTFTLSCTRYEQKVVPFQLPAGYANMVEVDGAQIATRAFDTKKDAESAFGFDILGAGVLPVQMVFDNRGKHPIEVLPEKAYLVDSENKLWPVLDSRMAYDRLEKKTELGEVAPKGAKYGALGGLAGGILGAAIGIVAGHDAGEAVLKGAAAGAAGGALIGGAQGMDNSDVRHAIREDLQNRSLQNRSVQPNEIAHGFIFFPGEAKNAKELRVNVKETDTGRTYPLTFSLGTSNKK